MTVGSTGVRCRSASSSCWTRFCTACCARGNNMPPLAQRNLFHDKVRLAVTLTGIVFAVVLIVVELGLFVGFTVTTSNLIDNSGADLWVTSKHVPYVEQGVPFSERKVYQVRAVPGVAKAEKLIT